MVLSRQSITRNSVFHRVGEPLLVVVTLVAAGLVSTRIDTGKGGDSAAMSKSAHILNFCHKLGACSDALDALAFTWVESVTASRPLTNPFSTYCRTTSSNNRRNTFRKCGFRRRS